MDVKMTNELEKQFFDTFGIEPSNMCIYAKYGYDGTEGTWYFCAKNQKECWTYPSDTGCKDKMTSYPQITDHILLELIFLQPLSIEFKYPRNIEELKNTLLGYYIEELSLFAEPSEAEIFKQQVQALFRENN